MTDTVDKQPVQEPVAWMNQYGFVRSVRAAGFEVQNFNIPLYLHPAPDQGAEIDAERLMNHVLRHQYQSAIFERDTLREQVLVEAAMRIVSNKRDDSYVVLTVDVQALEAALAAMKGEQA